MNKIKRIFVDLDGPLLEGKGRHYFCYRTILEQRGFKPVGLEDYWEGKRRMVSRRELLAASGAEDIYVAFLNDWLGIIESPRALEIDSLQEGALGCLGKWRARKLELFLVTMRRNVAALDMQLNATGLREFLDEVLVCDHSGGGASKAAAVRKRLSAVGPVEDALWIGDTEADWEAARALGCPVMLVSN